MSPKGARRSQKSKVLVENLKILFFNAALPELVFQVILLAPGAILQQNRLHLSLKAVVADCAIEQALFLGIGGGPGTSTSCRNGYGCAKKLAKHEPVAIRFRGDTIESNRDMLSKRKASCMLALTYAQLMHMQQEGCD